MNSDVALSNKLLNYFKRLGFHQSVIPHLCIVHFTSMKLYKYQLTNHYTLREREKYHSKVMYKSGTEI